MIRVNKKERNYANVSTHKDSPNEVLALLVCNGKDIISGVSCERDRLFIHFEAGYTKIHVFDCQKGDIN